MFRHCNVFPVYFNFGQNTARIEIDRAIKQVKSLGLRDLRIVNIDDYMRLIKSTWASTNDLTEVYHDPKKLFLPGRNIVFVLFAAIIAFNESIDSIVLSSLRTDISGDGGVDFIHSMQDVIKYGFGVRGSTCDVKLITPVKHMDKTDIVKYVHDNKLNLDLTWSCYTTGPIPCEKCPSCMSRNAALDFWKNN